MNAERTTATEVVSHTRGGGDWIALDLLATADSSRSIKSVLRELPPAAAFTTPATTGRAWQWTSRLLNSEWGLTAELPHITEADDVAAIEHLLTRTADLCAGAGNQPFPEHSEWRAIQADAESITLHTQGSGRWTVLHALTAVHTLADEALTNPALPPGRVPVIEALTALIETADTEHQRRHLLRQAVEAWSDSTTKGDSR